MSKHDNINCIYFHVNNVKQEVFYVGIGNNKGLNRRNKKINI